MCDPSVPAIKHMSFNNIKVFECFPNTKQSK